MSIRQHLAGSRIAVLICMLRPQCVIASDPLLSSSQSVPSRRNQLRGCRIENHILLFGGTSSSNGYTLWDFDLASKSFSRVRVHGTPPSKRFGHSAVAFDSTSMVMFGGVYADTYFADVHLYNLQTHSWSAIPSSRLKGSRPGAADWTDGPLSRAHHVAELLDGHRMIIHGGSADHGEKVFSDIHILDLHRLRWETLPAQYFSFESQSSPGSLFGHSSSTWGAYCLVVFGGQDHVGHLSGQTWAFDIRSYCWAPVEIDSVESPVPRRDATLSQISISKYLLHGGVDAHGNVLGDFWLLDLRYDDKLVGLWRRLRWKSSDPTPPPRAMHFAVAVGSSVWLFNGCLKSDPLLFEDSVWKVSCSDALAASGHGQSSSIRKESSRVRAHGQRYPSPVAQGADSPSDISQQSSSGTLPAVGEVKDSYLTLYERRTDGVEGHRQAQRSPVPQSSQFLYSISSASGRDGYAAAGSTSSTISSHASARTSPQRPSGSRISPTRLDHSPASTIAPHSGPYSSSRSPGDLSGLSDSELDRLINMLDVRMESISGALSGLEGRLQTVEKRSRASADPPGDEQQQRQQGPQEEPSSQSGGPGSTGADIGLRLSTDASAEDANQGAREAGSESDELRATAAHPSEESVCGTLPITPSAVEADHEAPTDPHEAPTDPHEALMSENQQTPSENWQPRATDGDQMLQNDPVGNSERAVGSAADGPARDPSSSLEGRPAVVDPDAVPLSDVVLVPKSDNHADPPNDSSLSRCDTDVDIPSPLPENGVAADRPCEVRPGTEQPIDSPVEDLTPSQVDESTILADADGARPSVGPDDMPPATHPGESVEEELDPQVVSWERVMANASAVVHGEMKEASVVLGGPEDVPPAELDLALLLVSVLEQLRIAAASLGRTWSGTPLSEIVGMTRTIQETCSHYFDHSPVGGNPDSSRMVRLPHCFSAAISDPVRQELVASFLGKWSGKKDVPRKLLVRSLATAAAAENPEASPVIIYTLRKCVMDAAAMH